MSKPPLPTPPKVTLEDLLRFKRTERPAPEFWTRFESELHQKQLAALVRKESWWKSLPSVFTRFSRLHIPLGATAALALTLVALHTNQGGSVAKVESDQKPASPNQAQIAGTPAPSATSSLAASQPVLAAPVEDQPAPAAASSSVTAVAANQRAENTNSASAETAELPAMIPWLGNVGHTDPATTNTSVGKNAVVARLSESDMSDAGFANHFASQVGFETRVIPARSQASLSTRTSRLLAMAYQAMAGDTTSTAPLSEPVRARTVRYLQEEGLDQAVGRLGAQGDRVSIKF